ncbi:MAG: cupin domain-containing protein [Spirochaetia bacterium]|nr:cupin domain-containing protein [Spirochaetia bacterium]
MQFINDKDVEFKNRVSGSKYLFVDEKKYAFGTAYLRPGDEIKEHVHTDETELFYFISGTPEFTCAGKTIRVKPGDAMKAEAGEPHILKNDTNETVHLNFIKLKVAG